MRRALLRTSTRLGPHWVLVTAVVLELVLEAIHLEQGSSGWLVLAALVAAVALVLVWHLPEGPRLLPLAGIAVTFHVAWVLLHQGTGQRGDQDTGLAFPTYGNELLDGRYPEAEYPLGAVLLFALEALLGGDSADAPNRFLMVPFQLACVAGVWLLRTPTSAWLASVLAIWPMSTYYWQYRFDLVPAAAIVVGLLLAARSRWGWSGLALAAGTVVKWVPALSFGVVAVWLVAGKRWHAFWPATAAFLGSVALVHVPFLLWDADNVLAAYRDQGGRAITNESFWFFPLSLLGVLGDTEAVFAPAGAPEWADVLAVVIQSIALLVLAALAWRARRQPGPALALAALAPAVFLLTNRIFSVQFLVVIAVAVAFAGALAVRSRDDQLLLGGLLMASTFANAFVYPFEPPFGPSSWQPYSAVVLATAFAAVGIVVVRAMREGAEVEVNPGGLSDALREEQDRVHALRGRPAAIPAWSGRFLAGLTVVMVAVFAVPALFAASVMPYRYWDSLAFGAWSRSIAETGDLWANAGVLDVSRPLFYVPQGLVWHYLLDTTWVGRVLSVAFSAALVAGVWALGRLVATEDRSRLLLPALAVATLLSSAVFANLVAAGMTDVPLAAATAATGLALLSTRLGRAQAPLVAACAIATTLAKVSGFLAIPGLVLAALAFRGRSALPGLVGLGVGTAIGIAYDAWQAARIDVSLERLLRVSNEGIWLERGSAARWDALGRAEWLGEGARLVVVFGLVHGLARALGLRPRAALGCAAAAAIGWSLVGPAVADGELDYPFSGSVLGIAAWLVLAGTFVTAAFLADTDPLPRRTYVALVLWLSPVAVAWFWQRADEVRHLAPAWPALILLAASAMCSVSVALARLRPAASLVPATALAVLAIASIPAIDGLGRDGWRDLLDLGPSRWGDDAQMENFAYGPFSYELARARENTGDGDRIVSSNGRLAYFFPGQVEVAYPRACAEVADATFFSYLVSGESLEEAALAGQPTDPLGWLQCQQPPLALVGEHPGIYAAFVVGRSPARTPEPGDCQITPAPGQLVDALFGSGLTYAAAKELRARAEAVGFAGVHIERTGCSTFNVVVTGVPAETSVQEEFRREVESVGLEVEFADAVRYPEVPPDVAAVP